MKTSELREMSVEDLAKKETELREERFRLKFKHGIRPLENTAVLSTLRKDIARIKTIIAEKATN
ncbi:MAG: 50S ribosomal protein L29 [Desulfobulbaceae bacterium]|nr:50S ribosomal protein L29 [Desulfobulbaceae bacterium]